MEELIDNLVEHVNKDRDKPSKDEYLVIVNIMYEHITSHRDLLTEATKRLTEAAELLRGGY